MGKKQSPTLTDEIRTFIVERFAIFDTPAVIAAAVKSEFGIEIARQSVEHYNPASKAGRGLAKKWHAIFDAKRKKFIDDTSEIAISHRSRRLVQLERMAQKAEDKGNIVLAAQLLEQAAKEMGGMFTNKLAINHTGKVQFVERDKLDLET